MRQTIIWSVALVCAALVLANGAVEAQKIKAVEIAGTVEVANQDIATVRDARHYGSPGLQAPIPNSSHDLITIPGPGKFVSLRVQQQGGGPGVTRTSLILDGETAALENFIEPQTWGLTQSNPFGTVVFTPLGLYTLTIGFPQPLYFEESLVLRVDRIDAGVIQISSRLIAGR